MMKVMTIILLSWNTRLTCELCTLIINFMQDTVQVTAVLNWTYSNKETPFYHHLIFVPHLTPVYLTTCKSRLAIRVFNFLVHCVNARRLNDVTRHETVVILKWVPATWR